VLSSCCNLFFLSLALISQKNKKASSSREQVLRSSSKALKVDNSSDEESEEDPVEDELAFISRNIRKMWKNNGGSRCNNSLKRVLKEKKDRYKSSIICYGCKKLGHFKSECPGLEKAQDKKKHYKTKDKKGFMSTWEDLDNSLSKEDEEEANLCLMTDTSSIESE